MNCKRRKKKVLQYGRCRGPERHGSDTSATHFHRIGWDLYVLGLGNVFASGELVFMRIKVRLGASQSLSET